MVNPFVRLRSRYSIIRDIRSRVTRSLFHVIFLQVLDSEHDQDLADADANNQEFADLLDELEDLSDSGPETDNLSVLSTPKPILR